MATTSNPASVEVAGDALAPHRVVVDDHHGDRLVSLTAASPSYAPGRAVERRLPRSRRPDVPSTPVHQRLGLLGPISTCSTTPVEQHGPADLGGVALEPDPGPGRRPRPAPVPTRCRARSPSRNAPPGAGATPANASARSRCSQREQLHDRRTGARRRRPRSPRRGRRRPSTRAGSPCATSTEETVSPARSGPAPVVHSVTAPPSRPRSRRTGSRSRLGIGEGVLGVDGHAGQARPGDPPARERRRSVAADVRGNPKFPIHPHERFNFLASVTDTLAEGSGSMRTLGSIAYLRACTRGGRRLRVRRLLHDLGERGRGPPQPEPRPARPAHPAHRPGASLRRPLPRTTSATSSSRTASPPAGCTSTRPTR